MATEIQKQQAEDEQTLPYDTADPQQVNTARKKAARTRADRLKFVDAAMDHKEGRAWFYDLLSRCRVFSMPYVSGDSHATAFRCGEQNIGNMILADIQLIASDRYLDMIRENQKDQINGRYANTSSDSN